MTIKQHELFGVFDGIEAACDLQNWINDNAPDELLDKIPVEVWTRITNGVIAARSFVNNSKLIYQHTKRGTRYSVECISALNGDFENIEDDRQVWVNIVDGKVTIKLEKTDGYVMAFVQSSSPMVQGTQVVLYKGENDDYWIRSAFEFFDGRFEGKWVNDWN